MILEDKNFTYKFDAQVCGECEGNCCIGESGYIWITTKEVENLAKYLKIEPNEVFGTY